MVEKVLGNTDSINKLFVKNYYDMKKQNAICVVVGYLGINKIGDKKTTYCFMEAIRHTK